MCTSELLRNGFLDDFRTAVENFTDPDENIVRILLFDLLGPSGIDLLLDSDDSGTDITLNDIGFSTADIGGKEAVQWNFVLGDTLVNAGADIGLDIGIPGLGLETEGSINLAKGNVDYDHPVPQDDKFYMPVQCQQCDSPPCVSVCPVDGCISMQQLTTGSDPRTGEPVSSDKLQWTAHPNNPMRRTD
ncbi:MAG: hypothetical protein IIC12_06475 [Proteobacteria bacterium]|nr:hypothetical protein [Pseudomonadota bacterium]